MMSQDVKGAEDAVVAVAQAGMDAGADGSSRNPFGRATPPPSIHDLSSEESSSSEEDEGEMSEARRRRIEKMNARIEKRARKLMKKRVKEEKEKHPYYGMYQVPPNYAQSQYPSSQFNPLTWDNLLTLMGQIIPSGNLI